MDQSASARRAARRVQRVLPVALLAGITVLAMAGCGSGGDGVSEGMRLQTDLGDHHHPITTDSDLAQRYFDQGLNLAFGFNHELAVLSFREAAIHDPNCAMCYWGVALALGPNINAPMGPEAGAAAWLRDALSVCGA